MPEGSRVVIRHRDDPALPAGRIEGDGVREVIWGVRDAAALDTLAAGLAADLDVLRDSDGTARFLADFGVPMGPQVFDKRRDDRARPAQLARPDQPA